MSKKKQIKKQDIPESFALDKVDPKTRMPGTLMEKGSMKSLADKSKNLVSALENKSIKKNHDDMVGKLKRCMSLSKDDTSSPPPPAPKTGAEAITQGFNNATGTSGIMNGIKNVSNALGFGKSESAFSSKDPKVQHAFNLQAQAEKAADEGDHQKAKKLGEQISVHIKKHPHVKEHMDQMGKYLSEAPKDEMDKAEKPSSKDAKPKGEPQPEDSKPVDMWDIISHPKAPVKKTTHDFTQINSEPILQRSQMTTKNWTPNHIKKLKNHITMGFRGGAIGGPMTAATSSATGGASSAGIGGPGGAGGGMGKMEKSEPKLKKDGATPPSNYGASMAATAANSGGLAGSKPGAAAAFSGAFKSEEKVSMPKKDFIAEHKDLVDTLKHPTKEKLQSELKEQSGELKQEMRKCDDPKFLKQLSHHLKLKKMYGVAMTEKSEKLAERSQDVKAHLSSKGAPTQDEKHANMMNEEKNMEKSDKDMPEKSQDVKAHLSSKGAPTQDEKHANDMNSKSMKKAEPLKKPYVSQKQAGFFHTNPEKVGGKKVVAEFDQATLGKHLPKVAKGISLSDHIKSPIQGVHTSIEPKGGISHSGAQLRSTGLASSRTHINKLKQLLSMPKPNLPKTEKSMDPMVKEEKGVHQRVSADIAIGSTPHKRNMSRAGVLTRVGTAKTKQAAKDIHQDKLNDLKAMPKPNLPKSEKK